MLSNQWFYQLADRLKGVEKIRIVVGLNVDRTTVEHINTVRSQTDLDFNSHQHTREASIETVIAEVDASSDDYNIEFGINKFIEYLTTDCERCDEDKASGGRRASGNRKSYRP